MTIHSKQMSHLEGGVTCDECGAKEHFDADENLQTEGDIHGFFRDYGWYFCDGDDEAQTDLCPRCAARSGLDPESLADLAERRAACARELNGIPLYSYAELGMSEAVL